MSFRLERGKTIGIVGESGSGKSEIGHGESLTVNQLLGRIDAVTPEDAARAAERVLSQPMTVTVLGPFSSKDAIA